MSKKIIMLGLVSLMLAAPIAVNAQTEDSKAPFTTPEEVQELITNSLTSLWESITNILVDLDLLDARLSSVESQVNNIQTQVSQNTDDISALQGAVPEEPEQLRAFDDNGLYLGKVAGVFSYDVNTDPDHSTDDRLIIMHKDYNRLVEFDGNGNYYPGPQVGTVFYEGFDCTGGAFLRKAEIANNFRFNSVGTQPYGHYIIRLDTSVESHTFNAVLQSGTCYNRATPESYTETFYEALVVGELYESEIATPLEIRYE